MQKTGRDHAPGLKRACARKSRANLGRIPPVDITKTQTIRVGEHQGSFIDVKLLTQRTITKPNEFYGTDKQSNIHQKQENTTLIRKLSVYFALCLLSFQCGGKSSNSQKKNPVAYGQTPTAGQSKEDPSADPTDTIPDAVPLNKITLDKTDVSEFSAFDFSIANDGKTIALLNIFEQKRTFAAWSMEDDKKIWESSTTKDLVFAGNNDLVRLNETDYGNGTFRMDLEQVNIKTGDSRLLYSAPVSSNGFTYHEHGMTDIAIEHDDARTLLLDLKGIRPHQSISTGFCERIDTNDLIIISSQRRYLACVGLDLAGIDVYEISSMRHVLRIPADADTDRLHFDFSLDEQRILFQSFYSNLTTIYDIKSGQIVSKRNSCKEEACSYTLTVPAYFSASGKYVVAVATYAKGKVGDAIVTLDADTLTKEETIRVIGGKRIYNFFVSPDRTVAATYLVPFWVRLETYPNRMNNHVYTWSMPE